jgi:excisionase family DNA binding protein
MEGRLRAHAVVGNKVSGEMTMETTTRTLVTIAEAAKQLGTSKGTLYGLVKQRRVPCYRFGDLIRLDLAEVLRMTRVEAQNGDRPCVVQPDAREKHAKTKGKT